MIHPRDQLAAAMQTVKPAHKPRRVFNNSSGWFEIDGQRIYAKSKWERNYARYLMHIRKSGYITEWLYEPTTFWFEGIKRGVNSYKPDFRITYPSGDCEYIEVKGYMDSKSKTKIKRMAKYHPEIRLTVLAEGWWKDKGKEVGKYVPEWE